MDVVRDNTTADHFSFYRAYRELGKKAMSRKTGQDDASGYAA